MVLTNIYVDLLAFCVVLIVCCGFASVSRMTGGGGRTFLACLGLEILILLIHLVGWYWNLSGRERGLFSDLPHHSFQRDKFIVDDHDLHNITGPFFVI